MTAALTVIIFIIKLRKLSRKSFLQRIAHKLDSELQESEIKLRRFIHLNPSWCIQSIMNSTPVIVKNKKDEHNVLLTNEIVYSSDFDPGKFWCHQVTKYKIPGSLSSRKDKHGNWYSIQVELPKRIPLPLANGAKSKAFPYGNRSKEVVDKEAHEFLVKNVIELGLLNHCKNAITILNKDVISVHITGTIDSQSKSKKYTQVESFALMPIQYSNLLDIYWCIDAGYAVNKTNNALQLHVEVYKLHHNLEKLPEWMEVDHINGDRLDCRISNLELKTKEGNQRNRASTSGKGFHQVPISGVSWNPEPKSNWQVSNVRGKPEYFPTKRFNNDKRDALVSALMCRLTYMRENNNVNGLRDLNVNPKNIDDYSVEHLLKLVMDRHDEASNTANA